uniref:VPS10 domain-containing receptor SorCS1-like n=1 Tax=Oncorhynchus gorbuscha TaxID=8017 RepID=UPI001EAEBFD2|nr:VPS10 domain-containing receptor SorCS1-like [Oncorhynchus gorbuscha]
MENVKTTQMLDLYEVAGIKGMLVADRRLDNQVKIYITYNKGRDWRFLQAPATGLAGNNTHCFQKSENPCLSGSISTKASAPGIIVATGNIECELSNWRRSTTSGFCIKERP